MFCSFENAAIISSLLLLIPKNGVINGTVMSNYIEGKRMSESLDTFFNYYSLDTLFLYISPYFVFILEYGKLLSMSLMISYLVSSVNLARFVAMIQQRSMAASSFSLPQDNMGRDRKELIEGERKRRTARGFKGRM